MDQDRSIYLELSPGRHAALSKRDSQSQCEIALQPVGQSFYEYELILVADFVGIPLEYVERFRNPPIKWVSASPTPVEQADWLSRVGSTYPYPRS